MQTSVTILNRDIDQNDTYGENANWWQFQWTGSLGNSYHVVTGTGTDATAILDDFTIRAGRGDDPMHFGGARLLVEGGGARASRTAPSSTTPLVTARPPD